VPSIFYSFSFMPNIDATRLFSPGADLVRYFRKVCNKYRISDKLQFDTDVSELRWLEDEQLWEVSLSYLLPGKGDLTTKEREAEIVRHGESAVVYKREKAKAKVIVSCVGGVVEPRDLTGRLPGLDSFQGPVFHSARWDPDADLENKDVVVLGAGSSASQLVPEIVKHPYNARTVTQVMRSPPWVHPKEVEPGGPEAFAKWSPWILNKAPWLGRLLRLMIFCIMELEYAQLFRTDSPEKTENNRSKVGAGYVEHMKKTVPQEYHEILTPRYAVGCKRRIFDKTWFPSLNDPKVDLVLGEISAVQPKSVTLSLYDPGRATDKAHPAKINAKVNGVATNDHISGGHLPKDSATKTSNSCTMPCDVLILANGFDIGSWIHPLCVYGRGSKSIHDVWDSRGGAQAYMGTALDGFPNFFMIFGPNTATGHSSVILACENMIEHALKFVKTIVVTREVDTYEIKEKDCRAWVGEVQRLLKGSVWTDQGAAGCGSWYVKDGWNSTAYP
jgi:cation diffusion facilitator CzcD-associated flavoprotein CzcO